MTQPPDPHAIETVQRAKTLLDAGRGAEARQLLGALMCNCPDLAEAHRLMAECCLQTGELTRGRKAARTLLRLAPGSAEAHDLLGRTLSAANQHGEAEMAFREALRLDPGFLPSAIPLTRFLLATGRAAEACGVIEPFARQGTNASGVWLLYGIALASLGRPSEAVALFQQVLEQQPGDREARVRLAAALADNDQGAAAEAEIRRVIEEGFDTADTAFILARALMGQALFAEAEIELQKAVKARPGHVTAQANLSELIWMRTGDSAQAGATLDRALQSRPDLAPLWAVKSRLLLAAGCAKDALAAVEAGLAHTPETLELLNMASNIALEFDPARALAYARSALRMAPDDARALAGYGNALLGLGEAREALATAEALQRRNPADGQSWAMQADALRLLGDPRYRDLLDYKHLLRADYIDTPAGWSSLESYLAELVPALEASHMRQAHPVGNSVRGGSQLELVPGRSPYPAIRAFPQAIDGPIRRYLQALGTGADAFRRRNSGGYRIQGMWSVRLQPNGLHVNHYHPQGWISSACYLHLPAAVGREGGAGWLKFGEPPFPTTPGLGPEYFLKPQPGLLALFPSYLWHGTVPFPGGPDERRITIAFDVVPA